MNLLEELRTLDPRDPGRWPLPIRLGAVAVWFVVLTFILSYLLRLAATSARSSISARRKSMQLRSEFSGKHAKAVNLEVYKQQLKDIERSFGALLRQLPGKTEVPNLLVDISQTGPAPASRRSCSSREPEQQKDFYAEKPIKIRLSGSYHEFGEFVSNIAALPRIVTLHDIEIKTGLQGRLRPADARPDGQDLPLPRRGRARGGRAGQAEGTGSATRRARGGWLT